MWTFREIAAMPDVVLQHLGKLLQKCRNDIAMPIQTYINLMASIPKKTGGSRCVAVSTTLYMLLMALDDGRLKEFEAREAFVNDSARAGADASTAAIKRALGAELLSILGKPFCIILWDYQIFVFLTIGF